MFENVKQTSLLLCFFAVAFVYLAHIPRSTTVNLDFVPIRHSRADINHALEFCGALNGSLNTVKDFSDRKRSDRYEHGTNATLIRNAVIWTGRDNGTEILHGSILLDNGIVWRLGNAYEHLIQDDDDVTIIDAKGGWVTPGLVDIHSHAGIMSSPFTSGTNNAASPNGPIVPWLRSVDGFDTHDESFRLAVAGGVTTIQVTPANNNAMGGEAFMVKLRSTLDKTPTSMLIEPPCALNGTKPCKDFRWRHLKLACGEDLGSHGHRMDMIWALRAALHKARQLKTAQDAFCSKVEEGVWVGKNFPDDLQWQLLVDALRGGVKTTVHCHEVVDLDAIVRLSNEFGFPIHSFQGASEAFLIPSTLNNTWQSETVVALSATRHRSKRETYRGSEYAPRILANSGIPVAFKSDHPHSNSRYLLQEAQMAHYYGLPENLALLAVTSIPANAVGLTHRLGTLFEGADADVVLWDSHPLRLGATPLNVWIDGIAQFDEKVASGEPQGSDRNVRPEPPNWDKEMREALRWDGLPPLFPSKISTKVSFGRVKEVWTRSRRGEVEVLFPPSYPVEERLANVVVESGKIKCIGTALACLGSREASADIDLHGGSISPSFMSYGSALGLEEIASEPSTGNGLLYDAFVHDIPTILGDAGGVVRAMDALIFSTRNALVAYRSGVTLATSSLRKNVFAGRTPVIAGISASFRTGFPHAMEQGAIVQTATALHISVGRALLLSGAGSVAVSEQMAGIRRLLMGWEDENTETGLWFKRASEGVIPLVIEVHSADIMAALLIMKAEIEDRKGSYMRMVFSGATEAHLLAKEISRAGVGVILTPSRPFPTAWEDRRILPGPPISNDTAVLKLVEAGVNVGIGVQDAWAARNTRFDVALVAAESRGRITPRQAHALASTNLEKLLGVWPADEEHGDLVVYDGGSATDLSSKVVAVISQQRNHVELLF
ncbi:hypothetical protein EYR40_005318 [Pleurotus pulmonarius]|nr:hypothetical protein EYR40_005318 [Pleurotus pulmonarius]